MKKDILKKLIFAACSASLMGSAHAMSITGETGSETNFYAYVGGAWGDGTHVEIEWGNNPRLNDSLFDPVVFPSYDVSFMLVSDGSETPGQLYTATMEYYGSATLSCDEEVSVYGAPDQGLPCQGGATVNGTNGGFALDSETNLLNNSYSYTENLILELDTLYTYTLHTDLSLWNADWDLIQIGGLVGLQLGNVTPLSYEAMEPGALFLFSVGILGLAGFRMNQKGNVALAKIGRGSDRSLC